MPSRWKGMETNISNPLQTPSSNSEFGNAFPVEGNRNFIDAIDECVQLVCRLVRKCLPGGREWKHVLEAVAVSVLQQEFGNAFPVEGNGNSPRGGHVQRQRIPIPDEQLAIVDCVD